MTSSLVFLISLCLCGICSTQHLLHYKSDPVIPLLKTFQRLPITLKIKSKPHFKRCLYFGLCCLSSFLFLCSLCSLCSSWTGLFFFLGQVLFLPWVFALAEPSQKEPQCLFREVLLDYPGIQRNPRYHLQPSSALLPYLIFFGVVLCV